MMKKTMHFCLSGLMLPFFLFMSLAFGGETAALKEDRIQRNKSAPKVIESLIVTAQKRPENVQDIPMSISAFSGSQIDDAGFLKAQELILSTPNLHMRQGGSTNVIAIRGITADADFLHSATGVHVDDINYALNVMHNPSLFDIERVEVLRGPQGTLYGRNSEAGVINIVTRQPDNHFAGRIYSELSAWDPDHGTGTGHRLGMSLRGPIVKDRFFMGIAGEFEESDGFIENTFNGDDEAAGINRKNGRLTTRWTPDENLEFGLILDFLDRKYGNGNTRYTQGPFNTPAHRINHDTDGNKDDQKGNGQALKIKYRGEDFTLLSITGRRFHETDWRRDIDCSPLDVGLYNLFFDSEWLSQEIRITSTGEDRPFEWIGGVFLYSEDNFTDIDLASMMQTRKTDMETWGYAAFGQATLTLFERLRLTAGLRYSYDDMEGEMDYYHLGGRSTFDRSGSEGVLLPKVSVAYDLTPDVMAYTTVSRGYNAGGFNTGFAEGPDNFTFDPEFTWNYEAGVKSVFLDNRLSFNLALFYIAIDDKQVAERDDLSAVSHIRNAAEAHSMGFEMEARARLAAGVDLFAGFGYTNIEFDEWTANGIDYEGKKMPNAPEFTGNIGVQYRHPSGFFGRSDLIVTDGFYSDAANTQKLDGKTLVNLRTGYERDAWDVMFWCKNLFNEAYQTMGFASMFDQAVDGEPRTFGATLTYYF